jgi:hypothetical protein
MTEYKVFPDGQYMVAIPGYPRVGILMSDPPGTFWVEGKKVMMPMAASPYEWTPIPEAGGLEAQLRSVQNEKWPESDYVPYLDELWIRTPPGGILEVRGTIPVEQEEDHE